MQNKHGWTNLEKIETDYSRGFRKLVKLTVFQSSFLLFITSVIMRRQFAIESNFLLTLSFLAKKGAYYKIIVPNLRTRATLLGP